MRQPVLLQERPDDAQGGAVDPDEKHASPRMGARGTACEEKQEDGPNRAPWSRAHRLGGGLPGDDDQSARAYQEPQQEAHRDASAITIGKVSSRAARRSGERSRLSASSLWSV